MLSSQLHSSVCAHSPTWHEVHSNLQRYTVTWNCISFKLPSKLKWAGKEVAQSWSPATGNPQSIPDSQMLLDPVDRGKCNGWNQTWGRLRKAKRYLVLLPEKEIKPWDSSFSRFSKVHTLRADISFYIFPSDEIYLKGHTVMGEGRMEFEQLTKTGRRWSTIWWFWITKDLCNMKVNKL